MHKLDQKGELLIPLVLVSVVLLASVVFGGWAFMSRQDYKDNVDQKIADAIVVAEENLTIEKDAEFAESYKLPNTTYRGPAAFGTLTIAYPKTWSNYVDEKTSGTVVDGFMQPNYVSSNTKDTNYALRYQVVERGYDQEVKSYEAKVKQGKVKTSAYRLPQLESVLGLRVEGEIDNTKQGVVIVLPLRDKTVKIWTEGNEFRNDFEAIIKQFTFIP